MSKRVCWWVGLQGREVEDGDVFKFNAEFTAQLFRIKINAIQLKETVEENKKTNDQVLQDRQYQVGGRSLSVGLRSYWGMSQLGELCGCQVSHHG